MFRGIWGGWDPYFSPQFKVASVAEFGGLRGRRASNFAPNSSVSEIWHPNGGSRYIVFCFFWCFFVFLIAFPPEILAEIVARMGSYSLLIFFWKLEIQNTFQWNFQGLFTEMDWNCMKLLGFKMSKRLDHLPSVMILTNKSPKFWNSAWNSRNSGTASCRHPPKREQ